MTQTFDQHEADLRLFQSVHEVAVLHAGRPVVDVLTVLRQRLPGVPGLDDAELLRIAEQISVGRDPSGL